MTRSPRRPALRRRLPYAALPLALCLTVAACGQTPAPGDAGTTSTTATVATAATSSTSAASTTPPTTTTTTTSASSTPSATATAAPTTAPTTGAVTDINLVTTADLRTAGIDPAGVTRSVAAEPGGGTTAASIRPISVCQEAQLGSLPGAVGAALEVHLGTQEPLLAEVAVTLSSREAAQTAYDQLLASIDACRRHVTPGSQDATVGPTTKIDLDDEFDTAAHVSVKDGSTGLVTYYGATVVGSRVAVVAYDGAPATAQTVPSLMVSAAKRLSPSIAGS